MKMLEESAKNVDLAVEKALKKLNCTIDQVDVKVISQGGMLKQAKVQVTKKASEAERVTVFLETLLEKMAFSNFVVDTKEEGDDIIVDLVGTDSAMLIGYRGETLDAIQYLTRLAVTKDQESYKHIIVDTENYREKRVEALKQLAKNIEAKVNKVNKTVALEPMNAYERRIVHSALQDSETVVTSSEGYGSRRYVTVRPKNQPASTPKKQGSKNFVYRSDKKRR